MNGGICEEILLRHFPQISAAHVIAACSELAASSDAHRALAASSDGGACDENTSEEFASFRTTGDWVNLILSLVCIFGAAMAAGLTMSTASLEAIDLRIKCETGTPRERQWASKLLPLKSLRPHHRLLVTLLLCNSVANEALPIFLDRIVPDWCAIVVSVTAVLFFGEIIPSAIFTGPDKLQMASAFSGVMRVLLLAMAPVAVPIAWVLDRVIPTANTTISRNEVRALVSVHRAIAREEGQAEPFSADEEDLVTGALSLSTLTPHALLRPVKETFTLPLEGSMDGPTMQRIMDAGFSRVPVQAAAHRASDGEKTRGGAAKGSAKASSATSVPPGLLVGYLLIKDLLMLDPADATPIKHLHLYKPVCCTPFVSLAHLLNEFQTGASHMAFVAKDPKTLCQTLDQVQQQGMQQGALGPESAAAILRSEVLGIITLEDVIEVLLTEQVYDESDRKQATDTLKKFLRTTALPQLRRTRTPRERSTGGASGASGTAGSLARSLSLELERSLAVSAARGADSAGGAGSYQPPLTALPTADACGGDGDGSGGGGGQAGSEGPPLTARVLSRRMASCPRMVGGAGFSERLQRLNHRPHPNAQRPTMRASVPWMVGGTGFSERLQRPNFQGGAPGGAESALLGYLPVTEETSEGGPKDAALPLSPSGGFRRYHSVPEEPITESGWGKV